MDAHADAWAFTRIWWLGVWRYSGNVDDKVNCPRFLQLINNSSINLKINDYEKDSVHEHDNARYDCITLYGIM